MRALLVIARLPGTGYTGDRVRAETHRAALARAGFEITVVGGLPAGRSVPAIEGVAEVHAVPIRWVGMPGALARAWLRGDPLQSALFAGPWRQVLSRAGARFDLVVWSLARLWPHLSGVLPAGPVVLDYVDALALAAGQAARNDPALWRRLYWKVEAPRLLRAERAAARDARALLATTSLDAGALPPGTEALPHGVPLGPQPPPAGERPAVVAFSGRLRYRPNELAAKRLVHDIWPLVRRLVPEAVLALGGADAPRSLLRSAGRDGVQVQSPVEDMARFLRAARVVAAPLPAGTGTPNKLFEAFEAGAPVVATPEVACRAVLDGAVPPVRTASSDAELADALAAYLEEPSRATADGQAGRAWAEAHASRERAVARLAEVFRAVAEGRAPGLPAAEAVALPELALPGVASPEVAPPVVAVRKVTP